MEKFLKLEEKTGMNLIIQQFFLFIVVFLLLNRSDTHDYALKQIDGKNDF
jgi:hypothetical protein